MDRCLDGLVLGGSSSVFPFFICLCLLVLLFDSIQVQWIHHREHIVSFFFINKLLLFSSFFG